MKKTLIVIATLSWLVVCGTQIYSKTRPVEFEIQYDQNSTHSYEIKKEMQETFDELVSGLHANSQQIMVKQNLKRFQSKHIRAYWKDKLILVEGDGRGGVISGELIQSDYCLEKVQPRSFLQELFNF